MNIWVPKVRILEPKQEIAVSTPVEGLFRLQVRRPNGQIRLDTGWFNNLITDVGLNRKGSSSISIGTVAVGTGTSTPTIAQTALDNELARVTSGGAARSVRGSPPYYGFETITHTFSIGAVVGNITEIGIFSDATTMISRALIVDGLGDPTSITVLADEQLVTSYEFRGYPPLLNPDGSWTDGVGQIDISGVPYDIEWRPARVTNSVWAQPTNSTAMSVNSSATAYDTDVLGAITSNPSGSVGGSVSQSSNAYLSDTFQRVHTVNWPINNANFVGGVGSMVLKLGNLTNNRGSGEVQVKFSPKIPKDDTKIMSLNYTYSWARRVL